jgi:hypothetical protein
MYGNGENMSQPVNPDDAVLVLIDHQIRSMSLRMSQAGVVLTSTSTLIGELAHDWQTTSGSEMRKILAETYQKTLGEFALSK